ncbi:hypothetical protein ACEQ8H_007012 [Pleosporales sp. CAS-2024a]
MTHYSIGLLARLQTELDILENGLATCVLYLLALRKKLARNERLLNADPPPTRKKRKKMEQSKRLLEREINNRQRDEDAFLSNLQVCRLNLSAAHRFCNQFLDLSSIQADCTSSAAPLSCEHSAPTEGSWNGWMGSVMSPFAKSASSMALISEVAPDEPLPIKEHRLATLVASKSVPATDCRSFLRPEAAVFEPKVDTASITCKIRLQGWKQSDMVYYNTAS